MISASPIAQDYCKYEKNPHGPICAASKQVAERSRKTRIVPEDSPKAYPLPQWVSTGNRHYVK